MSGKDCAIDLLELYPRFCGLAERVKQMDEGDEKERAEAILAGAASIYHILLIWRKTT